MLPSSLYAMTGSLVEDGSIMALSCRLEGNHFRIRSRLAAPL